MSKVRRPAESRPNLNETEKDTIGLSLRRFSIVVVAVVVTSSSSSFLADDERRVPCARWGRHCVSAVGLFAHLAG